VRCAPRTYVAACGAAYAYCTALFAVKMVMAHAAKRAWLVARARKHAKNIAQAATQRRYPQRRGAVAGVSFCNAAACARAFISITRICITTTWRIIIARCAARALAAPARRHHRAPRRRGGGGKR